MNPELLTIFVAAFVTMFVVIDPPGCAPIFASLTNNTSASHKRRMAIKAVVVATLILLLFAFLGQPLLRALGISLDAFRTAGGILLFLIAMDMVFEKRTERREHRAEAVKSEVTAKHHSLEEEDISVFPMALPMIAGPGSIGSLMLLMAKQEGDWTAQSVVLAAVACNLLLTLIALLASVRITQWIGKTAMGVITRLLGVILCALAAQFVFDGVRNAFA